MDNDSFVKKTKQQIKKIIVHLYNKRDHVLEKEPTKTITIDNTGFLTHETTLLNLKNFVCATMGVMDEEDKTVPEWMYVTDMNDKPLQTHMSSNDIVRDISLEKVEKKNLHTDNDKVVPMDSKLIKAHFGTDTSLEINVYKIECLFEGKKADTKDLRDNIVAITLKYYLDLAAKNKDNVVQNWLMAMITAESDDESTALDKLQPNLTKIRILKKSIEKIDKYNKEFFEHANDMITKKQLETPNVMFRSVILEKQLTLTVGMLDLDAIFQNFQASPENPLIRLGAAETSHTVLKFKMFAPFYLATNIKYLQMWLRDFNHIPAKCIKVSCIYTDKKDDNKKINYDLTLFATGKIQINLNMNKQDKDLDKAQIQDLLEGHMTKIVSKLYSLMFQLRLGGTSQTLALTMDTMRIVSSDIYFRLPDKTLTETNTLLKFKYLLSENAYFNTNAADVNEYEFIGIDKYQPIPKISKLIKDFFVSKGMVDDKRNCELNINANKEEIKKFLVSKRLVFSETEFTSALQTYCTPKYFLYFRQAQGIDVSIVGGNNNLLNIKNAGSIENLNTVMFYLRVLIHWSAAKNVSGKNNNAVLEKAIERAAKNGPNATAPGQKIIYGTKLERLQKFKKAINNDVLYSRKVQRGAQPVVLTKENLENIKGYFDTKQYNEQVRLSTYSGLEGERLKSFDKPLAEKDVIYTEKTSDMEEPLYYICPKAWCIKCELPFLMSQLLRGDGSGKKCPKCFGLEKKNKKGTLIIEKDDKDPWHPYMNKTTGYIMCGIKSSNKREEEDEEGKEKPRKAKKNAAAAAAAADVYIKQDHPNSEYGKFMYLPDTIHKILNGTHLKDATFKSTSETKFVRKGVLEEPDGEHYLSFEKALECLLFLNNERYKPPPRTNETKTKYFRKYLLALLKRNPNIQLIFQQCRKGSLFVFFDGKIDKLYNYIEKATSLNPVVILPLLGFPGVVKQQGINFFVFSSLPEGSGGTTTFDCEYINDEETENMLIYKYADDGKRSSSGDGDGDGDGDDQKQEEEQDQHNNISLSYYDPIVQLKKTKKTYHVQSTCESTKLKTLFKIHRAQCALAGNAKAEAAQKVFLNLFEKKLVYGQFVNSYNQTEGLLVSFGKRNFYYPLPRPMPVLSDLAQTIDKKAIPMQNLQATLKFLHEAAGIKHIYLLVDYTTDTTRRLYLSDFDTYVPLKNEFIKKTTVADLISSKKLVGIKNDKKEPEDTTLNEESAEQMKNQANADTHVGNFNKLKYLLSTILNTENMAKNKQIIEGKISLFAQAENEDTRKVIRGQLITSLNIIFTGTQKKPNDKILTKGPVGPWKSSDLHIPCFTLKHQDTCNPTSMCVWKDNRCKTIVSDNKAYTLFLSKLADELLTNSNLRSNILENRHPNINRRQIDQLTFYTKQDLTTYMKTHDFADNAALIKAPLVHFDYY